MFIGPNACWSGFCLLVPFFIAWFRLRFIASGTTAPTYGNRLLGKMVLGSCGLGGLLYDAVGGNVRLGWIEIHLLHMGVRCRKLGKRPRGELAGEL